MEMNKSTDVSLNNARWHIKMNGGDLHTKKAASVYIEIISLGHAKTQNTVLCAHSKRIQRGRKRQQAVSHLTQ